MIAYYTILPSPLGDLTLLSDGENLTGLLMDEKATKEMTLDPRPFKAALSQLRAYFAGELREFDLPLAQPGTEFQQKVWRQLQRIDYGRTASYRDVAKQLKKPQAMRAVGSANGKNRIGIIVPCHRVIAADGTLGGYGGGLWRKEWLLNHERSN
jgi:methylated-DNA-[protein]-cysteine S-methyltransferase